MVAQEDRQPKLNIREPLNYKDLYGNATAKANKKNERNRFSYRNSEIKKDRVMLKKSFALSFSSSY